MICFLALCPENGKGKKSISRRHGGMEITEGGGRKEPHAETQRRKERKEEKEEEKIKAKF